NPEEPFCEDYGQVADLGGRLAIDLPRPSERVAHRGRSQSGRLGEALSSGSHERPCSSDDLFLYGRCAVWRKQRYEVAQRERTLARRLCIHHRLTDVSRFEAEDQIELLQRRVVEVTRAVFGQRDSTRQGDLDGLRQRRCIFDLERSVRLRADGTSERQA